MSRRFPITERAFRAWLEAKAPSEVVGITRKPTECPLAAACGRAHIVPNVGNHGWWRPTPRSAQLFPLPRWANRFAGDVDDVLAPDDDEVPVTAKQALAVLNGEKDARR